MSTTISSTVGLDGLSIGVSRSTSPPLEDVEKHDRSTAPSSSDPIQNPSPEVSNFVPDLLQRRRTIPSTEVEAKNFISRRLRRQSAVNDPSIPAAKPKADRGAVRRGVRINANPKEILQAALPSESSGSSKLADYEYDSLNAYFINEEEEKERLEKEITRLVDIVNNPDRPLRLLTGKTLGEGSPQGYKALSLLSTEIMNAFHICEVDNDAISLIYGNLSITLGSFAQSMSKLQPTQLHSEENDFEEDSASHTVKKQKLLDATYALIDFVTATLARLITQIANGSYWHNNLLGALAKRSAKLKVILLDMENSSSVALRTAELALDTYKESHPSKDDSKNNKDKLSVFRELAQSIEQAEDLHADHGRVLLHCVQQQRIRVAVMSCLRFVLLSLRHLKRSGLPVTAYEVCAVVMETGFEGFKALLFQDRDYEFSSTSDLDNLNLAHSAFGILNATVLDLKRHKNDILNGPPLSIKSSLRTKIEWAYSEENDRPTSRTGAGDPQAKRFVPTGIKKDELELSSMDEIVTVMVPLALTSPVIAARFKNFLDMFYLTGDVDDIVRPYAETSFDAFFRLYTNDFEETRSSQPTDVLALSDAAQSGLFSRSSLMGTKTTPASGVSRNPNPQKAAQYSQKLKKVTEVMESWVYDESSVVVPCALYVWLVTIAAIILIGGGLAIGLTIHQRLKGVDPFNITVYAWALAAFIVLLCKSYMVQDWSWRDFLRGQVRCRSVSELRAVTGINEQLIMAKLLHDEQGSILITRGPYNSVFLRKAQGDGAGFSIDLPLNTKTLLLSGLSMLKVETPLGYALVCLDARRGTDLSVVEHRGLEKKDNLVCTNIDRLQRRYSKESRSLQPLRLPLKKSDQLQWKKVQGVYKVLDAVFV